MLYGPNGMGKSSLAKVLDSNDGEFNVKYKNKEYDEKDNELFHVINDQINRNIIKGEADDFLIGDNIKREYDLKDSINHEFHELFKENLSKVLKDKFNIATKGSFLIGKIEKGFLQNFVSDLANNRSKGDGIDRDDFIEKVFSLELRDLESFDEDKFNYLINNYSNDKSVIHKTLNIGNEEIRENRKIKLIEEHDEAIKVLSRFPHMTECIVCDNDIEYERLFKDKRENREKIIKTLDDKTKDILENIIEQLSDRDPFHIKNTLINALEMGNKLLIHKLQDNIHLYFEVLNIKIENLFLKCVGETNLKENSREYKEILEKPPEFENEDILLIENIINENMKSKINLVRDDHNIKLYIGDKELTNTERQKLHLSTGEQNFISLAFELLKAKRSEKEIIVLDDPISSFDSIYKNKIAFIIIKFLKDKRQIILTHNTELIKLLEHQKNGCFNLYLFNNTENEENGFIQVSFKEQTILLYIDELLELCREEIFEEVIDEKNFLISMIPFMRGYSQIISYSQEQKEITESLTLLMHGYEREERNLTEIYYELFGKKLYRDYIISAKDIIEMDIDGISILKYDKYPLLAKTLKHNLNYLYLRMIVEDKLVGLKEIDTGTFCKVGSIIGEVFKGDGEENRFNRVFLNSKKTLLNEFNHFEGNMSIFQPAIDITDTALKEEHDSITNFLNSLKSS